jgi:succinoglycan biosynthesis transport protein ExoP
MELRQYLALVRKWGWLIVLTTTIAAGSSYYYSTRLPQLYQSTTTLLVGQTLDKANPNANEFQATAQIANAYALLVNQQPILEATAQALNLPGGWESLASKVNASVPGDQLLQIVVTDTDPARAKRIADEVANQLILHSPTGDAQKEAEQRRTFVLNQLNQLQTELDTDQKNLNRLTTQAALETDPDKLKDLNTSISQLRSSIDNYQKNYASLSALLTTNSINFLTILAQTF